MVGIVTGASRGLGLALTRALSERGWTLVVDARDGAALLDAVDGLRAVTAIPGDIADPEHRRALVAAAPGAIDLLVSNAGTLGPTPLPAVTEISPAALRDLFEVNVVAPLELLRLAGPQLAANARVINVTSDAAVEAYNGWGGYGASKAALALLTAVLGVERPELRVYAVDPGDMRTRMQQDAYPGEDISDRPPPEDSVPGILELIGGDLPSGSYRARDLAGTRV